MTILLVSSLLTLMGVVGTVLAGREDRQARRWGWGVGLASEPIWIAFSVMTHAYPLIIASLMYGAVFAWNWLRA